MVEGSLSPYPSGASTNAKTEARSFQIFLIGGVASVGISIASEAGNRIPVSLLTGFLGSGKTTLLNYLVTQPEMSNCIVVINEFGEIALDQHFIEKSDGDVVVLANGCMCCSMQGDFETVIGALFAKRNRDDVPDFDRLLVRNNRPR